MKLYELHLGDDGGIQGRIDTAIKNLEKHAKTHKEALKQAPWKKSYGDCRGFSYNKKTGIAVWM